jgi:hypothetical protein
MISKGFIQVEQLPKITIAFSPELVHNKSVTKLAIVILGASPPLKCDLYILGDSPPLSATCISSALRRR